MKKLFTAFFLLPLLLQAQSYLLPSIGVGSLPLDTDTICSIPLYTGGFYSTGLQAGDTAYDFTLFSLTGDSIVLSDVLATGKPVLLVNGNYTCPVFRNKVNMINQVASMYAGLIYVAVIYTVEAHPTDISPYFGFINTSTANLNQGILFAQPTTYLERKNMVDTMLTHMTINVPVFIDGPCNNWWSTYGPAPNNAYLIQPDGIIFSKHGWFDKNPVDYILCDIDSLLYNTPCSLGSGSGNFSIQQIDTLVTGAAGSILYGFTDLINTTSSDITISAKKLQKNYPSTWQTAFCADVCYSPGDDSVTFIIPANDTMHFSIDFITGPIPDSGSIKIGFRNLNNNSNQYSIVVKAKTSNTSQVNPIPDISLFELYPNPVHDFLSISYPLFDHSLVRIVLFDITGKPIFSIDADSKNTVFDLSDLNNGLYFIRIGNSIQKFIKK